MAVILFLLILIGGAGLVFFLLFMQKKEPQVPQPVAEGAPPSVEDTISLYLEELLDDPENINLRFNLADVQINNDREKEGLGNVRILLQQGLEETPRFFFQALMLAAEAERRLENREGQRSYYRRALKLQPDNRTLNIALGDLEYSVGNFYDASLCANTLLASNPGDPDANFLLGQVRFRQGQLEEAIPPLELALDGDPENYRAGLLLGRVLAKQERVEEAVPWLQSAATAMKAAEDTDLNELSRVFLELGLLYRRNERNEEAEEALNEALAIDPDGEDRKRILQALLTMYRKRGAVSRVIWALQDLILLDPENRALRDELAQYQDRDSDTRFQKYMMLDQESFRQFCTAIARGALSHAVIKKSELNKNGSVDVIALGRKDKKAIVIFFRFLRGSIPAGTVEGSEVWSRVQQEDARQSYLVSPGGFSEGLRDFAAARSLHLVDRARLLRLLEKAGSE